MIGLVLVTHGRLAAEFVTAMEHVVGPQEQIAPICIGPEDDMEGRRNDIAEAIKSVDTGDGTIVLTDLFGGYDFARRVHFAAMSGIVGFVVVHLALVILVPSTLLPMFTGRAKTTREAASPATSQTQTVSSHEDPEA